MITIGTDVEFFLGQNGQYVCAHGLVPGTKWQPHPVKDGAVQVDGVAAEVNTKPTYFYHQFRDNLATVLSELKSIVPTHDFLQKTTVEIDITQTPDEALRLSCEPDFDPYEEEMNVALDEGSTLRSAGGHIHIGGIFTDDMGNIERYQRAIRLARLLDRYVGVYSLLWDKDSHRRTTYGKAGNCRIKPYGVEYRALSNAWLFNEKVMEFIYGQIHKAVGALDRGDDVDTMYRDIINSNDYGNSFFDTDNVAQEVKTYAVL